MPAGPTGNNISVQVQVFNGRVPVMGAVNFTYNPVAPPPPAVTCGACADYGSTYTTTSCSGTTLYTYTWLAQRQSCSDGSFVACAARLVSTVTTADSVACGAPPSVTCGACADFWGAYTTTTCSGTTLYTYTWWAQRQSCSDGSFVACDSRLISTTSAANSVTCGYVDCTSCPYGQGTQPCGTSGTQTYCITPNGCPNIYGPCIESPPPPPSCTVGAFCEVAYSCSSCGCCPEPCYRLGTLNSSCVCSSLGGYLC